MGLANTGQLIKAVAVDIGISICIIANGSHRGIIVSFAITVFVIAVADLFSVRVTMDREFSTIPGNKQMFFVHKTPALGF